LAAGYHNSPSQHVPPHLVHKSVHTSALDLWTCSSARPPAWSSRHRRPIPSGERAKPHGSRWSTLPDERPWPVGLGLLGLSWVDGDRMIRLPPQPPDHLDQVLASILEPEVPAGGNGLLPGWRAGHGASEGCSSVWFPTRFTRRTRAQGRGTYLASSFRLQ
jgi:hypothetical protein